MKVVYAGHGRLRENWGARATSKALHDLIAANNPIIGIIDSTAKDANYSPILYSPKLPIKLTSKIGNRRSEFLFRPVYKLLKKWGLAEDYLSDDIDKSLEVFLKIKDAYPKLNEIYKQIAACEALVLNGEGSFIFTTPARRGALFFLMIMKLAKKLGKKTYCLNNMVSDCPVNGRNQVTVDAMVEAFKDTDCVTLRDPLSYRILKDISADINCEYVPDALFSWQHYFKGKQTVPVVGDSIIPWPEQDKYYGKFDFSKPYICVSGSSLAAWTQKDAIGQYVALVNKLKETGLQLYLVPTCSGDAFLDEVAAITKVPVLPVTTPIIAGASVLANARVFVSGRFHPSIMASTGGTPCVFLGSNSHKTLSLQEVLEYPDPIEYNAIPTNQDIDDIFIKVKSLLAEGETTRNAIEKTVSALVEQTEKFNSKVL